jgi:DNA-binding XRE family transcriptional regulator
MARRKLTEEQRDISKRNVKEFREEFGEHVGVGRGKVTQVEFAKIAGIEYGTYTKYESGKSRPSTEAAMAIARVTGRKTDDLFSVRPGPADVETARASFEEFRSAQRGPEPISEVADGDRVLQLFAYSTVDGNKLTLTELQRAQVEDLMQQLLEVIFAKRKGRKLVAGGWVEEDVDVTPASPRSHHQTK